MNTTKKLLVIIGLGLAIAANTYFYISKDDASAKPASPTQAQATLIKIGEKCLDFGERAVAKDTPIIEFQQLEREAKRTNVIQRCMADNSYQQNPAWLAMRSQLQRLMPMKQAFPSMKPSSALAANTCKCLCQLLGDLVIG